MTNKIYKTSLVVTDIFTYEQLQIYCEVYTHTFNRVLDIQFDKMSYGKTREEQLMDINSLLERTKASTKGTRSRKNVEWGIIEQAAKDAFKYFQEWWKRRISSNFTPSLPSHMKSETHFRTSSILKVSKGGYIYFPKFRRIKLQDSSYVPVGSYKNIFVEKKCNRWYISMEAVESTVEHYDLKGSLKVCVNYRGDISFKDKFYLNITRGQKYQEALKRLKTLLRKVRREQESSEPLSKERKIKILQMEREIEWLRFRLENLRISYFQNIVRNIALLSPAELMFSYIAKDNENQSFSSQFFKDSDTVTLLKMIQRKLNSMGTEIKYSSNIKETALEKLNS